MIRLHSLKAIPITKDGVFAEAREIAELILTCFATSGPRDSPPNSDEDDPFDMLLTSIHRAGSTYSTFAHRFEAHAIQRALKRETSVKRAAEALGMKRSTFVSKITKMGLGATADDACTVKRCRAQRLSAGKT